MYGYDECMIFFKKQKKSKREKVEEKMELSYRAVRIFSKWFKPHSIVNSTAIHYKQKTLLSKLLSYIFSIRHLKKIKQKSEKEEGDVDIQTFIYTLKQNCIIRI